MGQDGTPAPEGSPLPVPKEITFDPPPRVLPGRPRRRDPLGSLAEATALPQEGPAPGRDGPAPASTASAAAEIQGRHHRLHAGHPCGRRLRPAAAVLECPGRDRAGGPLLGHGAGGDPGSAPAGGPPGLRGPPLAGAAAGADGHPGLPERPDRMGGPAPPPPPLLRPAQRPPRRRPGPVVGPQRVDAAPDPGPQRDPPLHRRHGAGSPLPLARPLVPAAAAAARGRPLVVRQLGRGARRRPGAGALGHPPAAGARLSRHLAGELRHPRLRLPQLRLPRPLPQLLVGGDPHLRGGLAQQPPRLPPLAPATGCAGSSSTSPGCTSSSCGPSVWRAGCGWPPPSEAAAAEPSICRPPGPGARSGFGFRKFPPDGRRQIER